MAKPKTRRPSVQKREAASAAKAKKWENRPAYARLSERQKRFVDAYNGSARAAAAAAGYNPISATQLMARKSIKAALVEKAEMEEEEIRNLTKEEVKKRRILTRLEIQEFWTKTILNEKLELGYRLRAADSLAKSKAMFIERVDVTSKGKSLGELIVESLQTSKEAEKKAKTIDGEVVDAVFTPSTKALPE